MLLQGSSGPQRWPMGRINLHLHLEEGVGAPKNQHDRVARAGDEPHDVWDVALAARPVRRQVPVRVQLHAPCTALEELLSVQGMVLQVGSLRQNRIATEICSRRGSFDAADMTMHASTDQWSCTAHVSLQFSAKAA